MGTAVEKQIKVAFILQDLHFGGTQRHALELAKRLDRDRFAPVLWVMTTGRDFAAKAEEYGLRVEWLSGAANPNPAAVWGLWKRLCRRDVDLLFPLTVVPNIWARILGRATGHRRIIGNLRGLGDAFTPRERVLSRFCDRHICNADALKDRLCACGVDPGRVTVIKNGVDVDFFQPTDRPDAAEPMILSVARLVEVKDLPTLVRAFALALSRGAAGRLRIVGDGPDEAALLRLASELGVRDRVEIAPGTLDLRPHYAEASVFALSSLREGLPNVILEAMASGLPTVATRAGGVPEVVEHESTGLLCPVGDVEGMATHLARLLSEAETRRRMGAAARSRAESDYSLETMVDRHERVMSSLFEGEQLRD